MSDQKRAEVKTGDIVLIHGHQPHADSMVMVEKVGPSGVVVGLLLKATNFRMSVDAPGIAAVYRKRT